MIKTESIKGLSIAEVEDSRRLHGINILTEKEREPWWTRLLSKFGDPLIIILMVAAVLSIGISFYEYFWLHLATKVFLEPLGIIAAILLATVLAFFFEEKAEHEFSLLNKVSDDEPVEVIRAEGGCQRIARRDVVVGDIVRLNTGCEIPADGELLKASMLSVDESSLTGEPICHKTVVEADFDTNATFPSNMVYRGTKVMEGHGLMVVTSVGDNTENGKVFIATQIDDGVKTPLNEQLSRLGKYVSIASYIIAVLVVVARIIDFFFVGEAESLDVINVITFVLETIMIAVTLIVVAVPEGLPMAITISLAYSMRRMLKTNNLVRKLHACETMGATTVICTDKTGTLTLNQMRVETAYFYNKNKKTDDESIRDGSIDDIVAEAIAVNTTAALSSSADETAVSVVGNPTEGALLLWLNDSNVNYQQLRNDATVEAELPFSTERKLMAVVVCSSALRNRRVLYVKGAPEIVWKHCSSCFEGKTWDEINPVLTECQQQGQRTIGFAMKVMEDSERVPFVDGKLQIDDAVFQGFVSISDPVREEVPAAIHRCLDAGIKLKIVTGDTPVTAREIGRRIGLWQNSDSDANIITGYELEQLSQEELLKRLPDLKIIARARPMDKRRLVEMLQRSGEVVAVTGDGTNDAPALKSAHVGLSMGDGTAVAKEASDITIIDNSFSSITRAVMWGRSLFLNLQRFILFQLTVNVCACLVVLFGACFDVQSPLTVTQMLWVNLIMDTFAAMALSSLPPSEAVMNQPPRSRKAFIIDLRMGMNILSMGIMMTIILLAFYLFLEYFDVKELYSAIFSQGETLGMSTRKQLTPYEQSLFFTVFVMMQFWNMLNVRVFKTMDSALKDFSCRAFNLIAAAIFFGQIAIVTLGGEMFNVVPLSLCDWAVIIVSTSFIMWGSELARVFRK